MTGGTSLAVWMGGATLELYRLLRSTEGTESNDGVALYRALLDLTRTTPVVDVITGTSAGGLNGSLLAAAVAFGTSSHDFEKLRETWMSTADLDRLLRPLGKADPPSILLGDDYLVPQLKKVINTWKKGSPPPVDLVTTFTLVDPRPVVLSDDFGERMDEVTHAGTLRFTSEHFQEDVDIVDKLAIASRVSASIPGLFETSYLPSTKADADSTGRPDFTDQLGKGPDPRAGWALDGGLVVNLPLTEALDRIFAQSSSGAVRRVVLYISPTPTTPAARTRPPTDRPSTVEALLTVVTAPRAEGVADDLREIREHNAAVDRQRSARWMMAKILADAHSQGDLGGLMAQFRERRAQESVEGTLARITSVLRAEDRVDRGLLRARLLDARRDLVPRKLPSADELAWQRREEWGWGISPLEQCISFGLGIVNRCLALPVSATAPVDPEHAATIDPAVLRARQRLALAVHRAREQLALAKKELHSQRAKAESLRTTDMTFWAAHTNKLRKETARLRGKTEGADLSANLLQSVAEWARDGYRTWPQVDGKPARGETMKRISTELTNTAVTLIAVRAHVVTIVNAVGVDTVRTGTATGAGSATGSAPPSSRGVREDAEQIWQEFDAVMPSSHYPKIVVRSLLRMHIFQTILLGEVRNREQPVEVMQLSWNAPDYLTGRSPADKLAGTEAARLGAFIKLSWRANDFYWGQSDAAARLISLLLDPRRLRYLNVDSQKVRDTLRLGDAVDTELHFLDHPELPIPTSLPLVTAELARRRQLQIARDELPRIAEAMRESTEAGGEEPPSARTFLQRFDKIDANQQLGDDQLTDLVGSMRIGEETLATENASPLLTRATTRAVSLVAAMVTGPDLGIPIVSRVARPLRLPTQILSALVSALTTRSAVARGAGLFTVALASAIVAVRLLGTDVPSGLTVLACVVLGALLTWALVRHGVRSLAAPLLVTAVAAMALVGPGLRDIIYTAAPAIDAVPLDAGRTILIEGGAVVRVNEGTGDSAVTTDHVLTAGSIQIRDATGAVSLAKVAESGTEARWKSIGFLNDLSLGRAALLILAIGFARSLLRHLSQHRHPPHGKAGWIRPLIGLLAAIVVGFLLPKLATFALTGTSPPTGTVATDAKSLLVTSADWLHEQQFVVVIVLLLLLGALLASGGDGVRGLWRSLSDGRRRAAKSKRHEQSARR